mgnify:FL=1
MQLKLTSDEARMLLEAHTKIDHWNIMIIDPPRAAPEPKPFNLYILLADLRSMHILKGTRRPNGGTISVKMERIKHVRAEFRAANVEIGLDDAKQFIERLFPGETY